MDQPLRSSLRVLEALSISVLAGVVVWVLRRMTFPMPFLWLALLGLLAGIAASLGTLGVVIRTPPRRRVLAICCTLVGFLTLEVADYRQFRAQQRRQHLASDYRLPDARIEAMIDADLAQTTGSTGFIGYQRATVRFGNRIAPGLQVGGAWLIALLLVELSLAGFIAVRWTTAP